MFVYIKFLVRKLRPLIVAVPSFMNGHKEGVEYLCSVAFSKLSFCPKIFKKYDYKKMPRLVNMEYLCNWPSRSAF
jgi:hypothetical protein